MASEVREEESLRVKIGEAKNLPPHTVSINAGRNTLCTIKLDREEIFRTQIVEKDLNPFYGEEFSGEIPHKFRYLSFYIYEASQKSNKVLGKVSLRRQELYKYHGKDHWFPLFPADADSEVLGKVHLEIKFDEFLCTDSEPTQGLSIRVVECGDLTVVNGACNPYAVVTLNYKSKHKQEIKRTNVRKKTICPHFDETFFFLLENRGQNHDRNNYNIEHAFKAYISVSLWHDDSLVSREVLGGMFPGSFLGEVKIPLQNLTSGTSHKAWYCLGSREGWKQSNQDLGALRLKISYTSEHVFKSEYYNDLRELLLQSVNTEPVSSSAAAILGDVVESRQDAAQPIMRIFLHHKKLVPFVRALARAEIKLTSDPNTVFRGNTLITKVIDELMKLVGLPCLHEAIKATVDEICTEHLSCEIDPARVKDGENLSDNMKNLKRYVEQVFQSIVHSGLMCPTILCEVFFALKEAAQEYFPDSPLVRYQVVSGFIFLRFFAPAILGPRLFDLRTDTQDMCVNRTLTLVSKALQGLGNLVSSKSLSFGLKEEYMVPLFKSFNDAEHIDGIRMYLDMISSAARANTKSIIIEVPIILKEGFLIKRAQGRKKFGMKNFKRRYFCLTNQHFFYSKSRDDPPLCVISIEDILAVETLQEESFKMKYMFQVVQPQRALYIQATNCVEEKEWLDILMKVCHTNRNRLKVFHPAAFINGHWLCCKVPDQASPGCTPVTGGLSVTDIQVNIDSDREVERIHSLYLSYMEKLEAMQDACASQEVYMGLPETIHQPYIEDTQSCFKTLNQVLTCVISLEQEHMQYCKLKQRNTVIGSIDAPIGDESYTQFPGNTRL
ncbi:ras GTPase-activating protein 3-like [Mizuhopecten yessoensis]|uniref:Ras GTPase-activating protein 3 n=1 Tax=Mizuhopecten yessoensis TaxID=6573 RepID=A0A210R0R4_MIZYE|nr:ras GTPase-activating protein 3-like [Mizuhopecten yessoensis]OWF54600.1 Ras GTPase-activating protein 3 [Mizuhopecten yessoensis]